MQERKASGMEERVNTSLLLSFYGNLLTDKQREVIRYHEEDDLSLSEIAEMSGISRQGVHDALRRGEEQLLLFEERLGLQKRWENVCRELRAAKTSLNSGQISTAMQIIDNLLEEEEESNGL